MRITKKITSIVLAVLMVVSMMSVMAISASATEYNAADSLKLKASDLAVGDVILAANPWGTSIAHENYTFIMKGGTYSVESVGNIQEDDVVAPELDSTPIGFSYRDTDVAMWFQDTSWNNTYYFPLDAEGHLSNKWHVLAADHENKSITFGGHVPAPATPTISTAEELSNACINGGEYNLAADITTNYNYVEKDTIIHGNGHTITSGSDYSVFYWDNDKDADLTLDNVTLDGNGNKGIAVDVTAYTTDAQNNSGCNVTFNNVTCKNFASDYPEGVGAVYLYGKSNGTFTNCTFDNNTVSTTGTNGLNGADIWFGGAGSLAISGGSYDEVYVNGGQASATVSDGAEITSMAAVSTSTVNVTDSTVTKLYVANKNNVTVDDQSTVTVLDAYKPTEDEVLDEYPAAAQVGETKYGSLAKAINAAQDGDTVKLLSSVTETVTISGKTLTLDLNGFKITSTSKKMPITAIDGTKLTIRNSNTDKAENTATQNAIMGPSGSNNYGSLNAKGEDTTVDIYAGYYYGYNGNKTAVNAINGATVTFWGGTVNGAEGINDTTAGKEGKVFYSGVSNPTKPYATSPGTIIVHGGNFSGRMSDSNWGNYVIDGGTFDRNVVVLNENPVDANGNRVATASSSMTSIGNGTLAQAGWLADGYFLKNNGDGAYTVEGPYAAKIGDTGYATLEEAFAAAVDGDTIEVLADCAGNGIKVLKNTFATGLTVDFGGHTYTVDGETVGSPGTETLAFQLQYGNNITFKNGTLYSEKAKMLVQNYSNLTLDGMKLTFNNTSYNGAYTLSNNNGNTVIKDTTINANPTPGSFAFDVCRGGGSNLYPSVNVTVTGESVINGNVEVYAKNADPKEGFSLKLLSGTMTGNIVVDPTAKAVLDAKSDKGVVTKDNSFGQTAPEGLVWEDNGDGTSKLVPAEVNPLDALITKASDGNKFGITSQYYAGTILGVQKKEKITNAAVTSDKGAQEAAEGSDMRFVAVLDTETLQGADDYGFVLAKVGSNKDIASVGNEGLDKLKKGDDRFKTISAMNTYNTVCGTTAAAKKYGDPTETTTAYKYITCAVNGVDDSSKIVARFYVVKDGKTYYAKYAGHSYKYRGAVAGISDLV